MNTLIEIHDNNTNETGFYSVWYRHNGATHSMKLPESYVNALLNMRQKEQFFMGKYKFKIGEYDFIHLVVNGENRSGL